ncbi:formate/nitrite transporter family protein [Natronosalvus halobius]|uniref:formate/nitrite transporter family protein n=1 Tax=Natronosalvus halobius TaxID=2953746 RepID=UPI00209D87F5|nr:formate/nitrite transporter family protein [Natronosalvus halobius]USZ72690.1 formate/nitrite transporter family protein [Natronosalvus halobius]
MSDDDDSAVEIPQRAESGAPAYGTVMPDRFSSDEVFQRIVADADHEITSGVRELFFSALAGGFAITITFLVYASMSTKTESDIVAALLYPLGFIYIIIGGYQLYTENTLPPVALVLERLSSVPTLLRHWVIVLAGNFAGGALGAVALAYGGVFDAQSAEMAIYFAEKGIETPATSLFFKGAFAGLVVAGVVWINFAVRDTTSRLLVVYLAFLTIPLGDLYHVVVSFTEVVYLILVLGDVAVIPAMTQFVIPVLLGNTLGGVLLVTVVNYYQTSDRRLDIDRYENARRLTIREWLLGSLSGRTYVPVVDTVETIVRDEDSYRILVPIANPRTEARLVEFACALAETKEKGQVHVVHIVQTPQHMADGGSHHDRIVRESDRLLEDIRRIGDGYDVEFGTSTIVSPRSFEEIFDRARRTRPDLVLLGWGQDQLWTSARAESHLDELTNRLPADFLVVKDRGLDPSRVLLPTAGGPDSNLSAEIAQALETGADAEISLLHVVDEPADRAAGEAFLSDWANDHGLENADIVVDDSGDVERAICRTARDLDSTIVMMGATERGLLSRLVKDSLHIDVANVVDGSVLLSERPSQRTFTERLFGTGSREDRVLEEYRNREENAEAAEPRT